MSKRYRQQHSKQQQKRSSSSSSSSSSNTSIPVATSSDWDRLVEDPQLGHAWEQFAKAISVSQYAAEERSHAMGLPVTDMLDLRNAGRILSQYPQLMKYLDGIKEREAARLEAMARPDLMLAGSPSGGVRGDNAFGGLGSWAGTGFNRNNPIGVHNAKKLRDWADSNEWTNAALNFLSEKVAHADIAVLPADNDKPYNRKIMKQMELMLDQPNELRDTWPMLVGMFVRDLLTLGQGVFTKSMTPSRLPVSFYAEDAANVKTYPAWSGDPDEPRYLYQEGTISMQVRRVPLRNDEAIVVYYSPATYRYGQGPVQTLAWTIQADINATKAAMHLVDFKPPPHAIQIENATEQQIRNLRSNYESEIQGRREVMFLGGNTAHVFPLVFSAKDNQWLEWQEYLARKICACFSISPQDLGITYQINKATAEAQQEISDTKGFVPLLLLIEGYMNREFLADFAPAMANGRRNLQALNLRVVFPEVSEAARMLHTEKSIELATNSLAGLPSATLNQILAMRGEEPVEGGNTFYVKTAIGAVPWLSYDGETGDYTSTTTTAGDLGAQDAAGGIAEEDTADDDTGTSATSETPTTPQEATVSGANVEVAGAEGSLGSDIGPGAGGVEKQYKYRGIKSYQQRDIRKPGTNWNPASSMLQRTALPTTKRGQRVPTHIAATWRRPEEEEAARKEVAAAVKKVFEDASKRAQEKIG